MGNVSTTIVENASSAVEFVLNKTIRQECGKTFFFVSLLSYVLFLG